MLEKIEALRNKPKHVRNQYAFGAALAITSVIVLVWALTLPAHFKDVDTQVSASQPTEGFGVLRETLGTIADRTSDMFVSVRSHIDEAAVEEPVIEEIDFRTLLASSTVPASGTATTSVATNTATTTATTTASTSTHLGE